MRDFQAEWAEQHPAAAAYLHARFAASKAFEGAPHPKREWLASHPNATHILALPYDPSDVAGCLALAEAVELELASPTSAPVNPASRSANELMWEQAGREAADRRAFHAAERKVWEAEQRASRVVEPLIKVVSREGEKLSAQRDAGHDYFPSRVFHTNTIE